MSRVKGAFPIENTAEGWGRIEAENGKDLPCNTPELTLKSPGGWPRTRGPKQICYGLGCKLMLIRLILLPIFRLLHYYHRLQQSSPLQLHPH